MKAAERGEGYEVRGLTGGRVYFLKMPPNMEPPARGIIGQQSMSSLMMRAEKKPVGSLVWVEDSKDVWVRVQVVNQDNTMLTIRHTKTGIEDEIDLVREACVYLLEQVVDSNRNSRVRA